MRLAHQPTSFTSDAIGSAQGNGPLPPEGHGMAQKGVLPEALPDPLPDTPYPLYPYIEDRALHGVTGWGSGGAPEWGPGWGPDGVTEWVPGRVPHRRNLIVVEGFCTATSPSVPYMDTLHTPLSPSMALKAIRKGVRR